MKRILIIGLAVACLHFLFFTLLQHISPESKIALIFWGLFSGFNDEWWNYVFDPVFAIIANSYPASLFSWKPIDYTYCLLASSAVYGLVAAVLSLLLRLVKANDDTPKEVSMNKK